MPAYNETLGLVGSGGKYLTRWGTTRGWTWTRRSTRLKAELQAIWDKG